LGTNTLGTKIKFFRKRAGMSQMELENEVLASAGVVSRFESDSVNPSIKTLRKISVALKLSEYERSYLYGTFVEPVSPKQVELAREKVKTWFDKKGTLAYMVDERSRVWFVSDSFLKFMKIPKDLVEKNYGEVIHKFLVDPELNLITLVPRFKRKDVYRDLFHRTRREMSFMIGDPWYKEVMKYIDSDDLAQEVWKEVLSEPIKELHTIDNRIVLFKMGPIKISKQFSVEPVLDNERFRVVEWS